MQQQPAIVRGTIADNVALGQRTASIDEIRTALALAGAKAFVEALTR